MAVRLSDSWLDELRSKVNIVDVVSDYVSLKHSGRKYWGLCPFHGEKTASFSVDPEAQLFYCFGCHKGGNVIHFVMELERMEFMDAVKLLAERAHMRIPDSTGFVESTADREKRLRIYEANLAAAKAFHARIWTPACEAQLEYLHRRGLDDSDIRRFGLGAADDGWDTVLSELTSQGFQKDIIVQAGLAVEKNGKCFDMFRSRAIFPIIDAQGRILGFGGRAMGDAQPKYLNTPDTPVFNKRNGLYAMNFVKKERPLKRLVLVEGYMDVVSMRKHGVAGVVATLGTALTPQQVNLLKRNADEVWLAYDGDSAGQKAILRGLDLLDDGNVASRVIVFPGGQDPDDFIKAEGVEGFDALPKLDPVIYRMNMAESGLDMSNEENRRTYAMNCCKILKKVRSPIELDSYVKRLSLRSGIDYGVIMNEIGAVPVAREKPEKSGAPAVKKERFTEGEIAQRTLLALIASKLIDEAVISVSDFDDGLYREIASKILSGKSAADALNDFDDEKRQLAAGALSEEILPEQSRALGVAEDCLATIRRARVEREKDELQTRLKSADAAQRKMILQRINELNKC